MTVESYQRARQIQEEIYLLKRLKDQNEKYPFSITSSKLGTLSEEHQVKIMSLLPINNTSLNSSYINNIDIQIKLLNEEFKKL